MDEQLINRIIDNALLEDFDGAGDVTSEAIFTDEKAVYILKAKDTGVVCGIDIFAGVFRRIDAGLQIELLFKDGDFIEKGSVAAKISGKIISILKGERSALNILSHLSGIATRTAELQSVAGNVTKVLDTRKTLPGLRALQKYAVKCGGGVNHRMGLYDMVMIKDNHIDGAGSITEAVRRVRERWGSKYKIEVETRNLDEIKEALDNNVDRIMLDNMDNVMIKEAYHLINKRCEIEVSGNMNAARLKEINEIGVDFVSFGELTHSVRVFDYSLVKE